jgi:putative restriction endonuclease
MNPHEILQIFASIRMAPAGGGRAVHKPLLILLWLARLQRGEPRLALFADVEDPFRQLLVDYGSLNSPNTRQLPFWHLCNDADGTVWALETECGIRVAATGAAPGLRWFRESHLRAGFTPAVDDQLRHDEVLRATLAKRLLEENFSETLHSDIASQLGLNLNADTSRHGRNSSCRHRDPAFRERVLRAYEYKCCVCRFDLRIGNVAAGLEAAHIKWFTAGGPDVENNGLAMCALHHKLLDLGAFTVEPINLTIRFSQNIQFNEVTRSSQLGYHGAGIVQPQSNIYRPEAKFLAWHRDSVFRKPARE